MSGPAPGSAQWSERAETAATLSELYLVSDGAGGWTLDDAGPADAYINYVAGDYIISDTDDGTRILSTGTSVWFMVTGALTIRPGAATLTLTTFAPTVSAGGGGGSSVNVTPAAATLTLATFAPTVSTGASARRAIVTWASFTVPTV